MLTPIRPIEGCNDCSCCDPITKEDIGLGNVDNTSDLNKPISNDVQSALNQKADATTVNNINNRLTVIEAYNFPNVATRLGVVEGKVTILEGDMVNVKSDILSLQNLVGTNQGAITNLVTADGQNVKLTGNQTINGNKTFNDAISFKGWSTEIKQHLFFSNTAGWHYIRNYNTTTGHYDTLMQFTKNDDDTSAIYMGGGYGLVISSGAAVRANNYTLGASEDSRTFTTVGYVADTGGSLNNLLHSNGDESKTGLLTFKRAPNICEMLRLQDTVIDYTTRPLATNIKYISWRDKDNDPLANLEMQVGTDGSRTMRVTLYDKNGNFHYKTLYKIDENGNEVS